MLGLPFALASGREREKSKRAAASLHPRMHVEARREREMYICISTPMYSLCMNELRTLIQKNRSNSVVNVPMVFIIALLRKHHHHMSSVSCRRHFRHHMQATSCKWTLMNCGSHLISHEHSTSSTYKHYFVRKCSDFRGQTHSNFECWILWAQGNGYTAT